MLCNNWNCPDKLFQRLSNFLGSSEKNRGLLKINLELPEQLFSGAVRELELSGQLISETCQ